MSTYEEFYKSYTDTLAAFAKAARAETTSGFGIDESVARSYEEGFKDAMAHAFTLITGHEPDTDLYETTCEDALCDGFCNSNYCADFDKGWGACDHSKFSTSPFGCTEHPDKECYENRCDNCSKTVSHAE